MDAEDGMGMDAGVRTELLAFIDKLSPELRLDIAKLPPENVILLHHGLGTLIRNCFRAGKFKALHRWAHSRTSAGAKSFDDLSWPVLVAIWTILRSSSKQGTGMPGRPQIPD